MKKAYIKEFAKKFASEILDYNHCPVELFNYKYDFSLKRHPLGDDFIFREFNLLQEDFILVDMNYGHFLEVPIKNFLHKFPSDFNFKNDNLLSLTIKIISYVLKENGICILVLTENIFKKLFNNIFLIPDLNKFILFENNLNILNVVRFGKHNAFLLLKKENKINKEVFFTRLSKKKQIDFVIHLYKKYYFHENLLFPCETRKILGIFNNQINVKLKKCNKNKKNLLLSYANTYSGNKQLKENYLRGTRGLNKYELKKKMFILPKRTIKTKYNILLKRSFRILKTGIKNPPKNEKVAEKGDLLVYKNFKTSKALINHFDFSFYPNNNWFIIKTFDKTYMPYYLWFYLNSNYKNSCYPFLKEGELTSFRRIEVFIPKEYEIHIFKELFEKMMQLESEEQKEKFYKKVFKEFDKILFDDKNFLKLEKFL